MCIRIVLLLMPETSDDRTMWSFFVFALRGEEIRPGKYMCRKMFARYYWGDSTEL